MTQAFDQNLGTSDRSYDSQSDSQMRNTAAAQWGNADGFRSAIHAMTGGDTTNGALPNVSIDDGERCHGRMQGEDTSNPSSNVDFSKLGDIASSLGTSLTGAGADLQKNLSSEMTQLDKDLTSLSSDLDSITKLLANLQSAGTTGSDLSTQSPATGDQPSTRDVPTQNPTNGDQTSTGDAPTQNPTNVDQTPTGDAPTQNPTNGDQTYTGDAPTQNPTNVDQTSIGDVPTPNPTNVGQTSTGDVPTQNPTNGDQTSVKDGATQNPNSGDQQPVVTTTVPTGGPNSGFSIESGKLTVNGKTLAGVAVTGEYAQQVGPQTLADQISSQFPGINVVRLSTSPEGGAFTNGQTLTGGETVDNINQTIAALNAKGIGVIVDNHGSDANTQNNVSQTGNEAAWFSQIAAAQANNNMVMFQPENEPTGSDADVAAEQQTAYNAIRSTENATPGSVQHVVAFDLVGGGYAGPQQNDASVYDAMSNYVIDAHAYASNSDDPVSAIQAEVAQTANLTEADGSKVPVSIFETGNSIDGSNLDPNSSELLNYVYPTYGAVSWLYDGAATGFGSGNGADHLTDSNGNLTSFGQEIQQLISATSST